LPVALFVCLAPSSATAQSPVEIRVTARRFEFQPKTITVRKGDRVRLVIRSLDGDHGFAIDALGISKEVTRDRDGVVEFTPEKEGRYKFYCSVFCGDGHDKMVGELIVAPQNMQVRFDDTAPGVVIVESGGERLRIDTATKTVSRLSESRPAPAPREPPAEEETAVAESEPYDYRLVNVPTPKRVPRHSVSVYFTHRFQKPIHDEDESFGDTAREFFGLDSLSVSALGVTYGFTDRLYGTIYRSPICQPAAICKTIEMGLGYHILDEAGRSPIALSAYASVEGADNFSEHFTFNIQGMFARSVTKYVNLFFSPAVHINANGQGQFNPRPTDFFPPSPLASQLELGEHTGSFGFGVNARIRPSVSLLFDYTPRIGFKMGQIDPVFDNQFNLVALRNKSEAEIGFGIEKRIGRHAFTLTFSNTQSTTTARYNSSNLALGPKRLIIGFNLFRRLY
jgi:cytochrome c oxidase subunit 2